ncbi:MAG: sigma-70 family RNA polymerase sigma factor [Vicinamibacterales bacterium]
MNYERLFLEQLSTIERLARTQARRHRLPPQDCDDFVGHVRVRLMEHDYRVLREYEGRSRLATYLSTVIGHYCLDYRNQEWGRFRTSARAQRLGPVAEDLERLVLRDGHTLDEAIGILTVNQHVGLTDAALRRLWAELPPRTPTTLTTEDAAERVAHGVPSVEDLLAARQTIPLIERALSATLARAAPADRALAALHYGQAVPVARLAVQQHVSKATAHRRLTRVVEQCRQALTEAGVDRIQLAQALAFAGSELPPLLESLAETIAALGRLSP